MLILVRVLLLMMLATQAGVADAQRVSAVPRATAATTLLRPVTLITTGNLDFGTLAVTGAGTAVVNPASGQVSTSGGLAAAGGSPRAASFAGASGNVPLGLVLLPRQPVTIRRVGGTETLSVQSFTMRTTGISVTPRGLTFGFNVGATLIVPAGQADGVYAGTFDVTILYP